MAVTFVYIFTSRGTLVCFDRQTRRLFHRPLTERSSKFTPVVVSNSDVPDFALAGSTDKSDINVIDISDGHAVKSGLGLFPGSVTFNVTGMYVTAEPDFLIALNTRDLSEAASFLLITKEQLYALQTLVTHDWVFSRSRLRVSRNRISVGKDFTLFIGELKINLLTASLLFDNRSPDYIDMVVSGSDQADFRIERVNPLAQEISSKTIWIQPAGNMGNRALQYLTAEGIRMKLPEVVLKNLTLPEWDMVSTHGSPPQSTSSCTVKNFWIDTKGLADCIKRDVIDSVILTGYPFNIDHYPPRAVAKKLLPSTSGGKDAKGFGKNELVCSVRAAEILTGFHPDYIVLPPGYYQLLAEHTGLELVFFGQLGEDPYSNRLHSAFPSARFVAGRDPQYDFDTLRRSVNIAPSVSTFAWLAAWLSDAQKVFIPIAGMFNPIQHPRQTYLPYDDETYEFILFPYAKAVDVYANTDSFVAQQDQLSAYAQLVGRDEVREICERSRLLWPPSPYVGGFDPKYYLDHTPEAIEAVCLGKMSALQHYYAMDYSRIQRHESPGYRQRYNIMAFDGDFYLRTYPEVAMDISRGYFRDALHHYSTIGITKNYHVHGDIKL